MILDFIDVLTTFQDGFAGTVLFFSDYFMNGILGRAFFRTTKSLEDASVRMGLMASGVWMLGNFFSQILVSKDNDHDKRAFVLYKIFMFGSKFFLYAHTAFFNPSDDFNRTTFGALAITCLYNTLWLSTGLFYASKSRGTSQQNQKKGELNDKDHDYHRSQKLALLISLLYGITWAMLFSFFTDSIGPKGKIPFFATTGNENDELDAIQRFVIQLEGAHGMSVLALPYCIWSRAYQMNVATVIVMTLWIAPLLRAILDKSGTFNTKAFVFSLLGHVATLLYIAKLTFTKPVTLQAQTTKNIEQDRAAADAQTKRRKDD